MDRHIVEVTVRHDERAYLAQLDDPAVRLRKEADFEAIRQRNQENWQQEHQARTIENEGLYIEEVRAAKNQMLEGRNQSKEAYRQAVQEAQLRERQTIDQARHQPHVASRCEQ